MRFSWTLLNGTCSATLSKSFANKHLFSTETPSFFVFDRVIVWLSEILLIFQRDVELCKRTKIIMFPVLSQARWPNSLNIYSLTTLTRGHPSPMHRQYRKILTHRRVFINRFTQIAPIKRQEFGVTVSKGDTFTITDIFSESTDILMPKKNDQHEVFYTNTTNPWFSRRNDQTIRSIKKFAFA